jgi:hypothetical protein
MGRAAETEAPRWVWSDEVMDVLGRAMASRGVSLGELARRAAERFGTDPESAERRLRAARAARTVMDVHTADRYLVLMGCHLTDLPCYRRALLGELPREHWPRRGGGRAGARGSPAWRPPRSRRSRSPAAQG